MGDRQPDSVAVHGRVQTAAPSRPVSAAGTTANCIAGAFSLLLFSRLKTWTPSAGFCWLFGVFNLMNSGDLVASAVTNSSDWANVIAGLSPPWLWRCILGLAGIILHVKSVNLAARLLIRRFASGETGLADLARLTLPAYLAAGLVMTIASIFNPIGPQLILPSGVAPSFGLNAGLLWVRRIVPQRARTHSAATNAMPLSFFWIALALLLGGVFVAVLGPGIRFSH
ncbi:MAG TPA: hypothetical protein VMH81_24010 [Bryobacteraceae bacterium]|nr:hypothetical protein [Bryobacteraceae bacterium]